MTPQPSNLGLTNPHTVLIVEDNEDGRFMLRTFLQLKGYRVMEAGDGMEAITVATLEKPDLILMDLQLPVLDGLSVTRHLRLNPLSRYVPIVIVSGWDPKQHRPQALAAGCDEYLFKPVDFSLLEEVLKRHLPAIPRVALAASGELELPASVASAH
ncbi:MAG: two-component system, cell cycle response regulator DivK [Blastocatellia bacterium]|jgi:CheY-like chemotaxis protein|nr:two-component system, cell cycle response regulator DivK [Blastocatellia bacterium]